MYEHIDGSPFEFHWLKGQRSDPGFLERGFIHIKKWGVRFADFISFFLNILRK